MQRRASLVQGLLVTFALSPFVIAAGCAQPASGGGTGGSNGNGGSGNGGSGNRGGSTGNGGSNTGNGGSNTGSGGSHTGGTTGAGGVQSTGGTTGSGGSNTGSGGTNTGAGGTNTGAGGSHTGGTTGAGGTGTGTGGTGTGGTGTAGSSGRACGAPASPDVVADFEEGFNQNVAQGSRQGWWSAFGDTTGTQTPASGTTTPAAAAAVSGGAPTGDTCDMYALHSTGTGHSATSGYVGFGAPFNGVIPPPASGSTSKTQSPYDVSAYDGVSFNIKSGSGTAPPIWVEFHNTENVPTPDGTAKYQTIDQYNTRGMLLTGVGTSWQKVFVPFPLAAPRYLPSTSSTDCSGGSVFCQAPPWDSKNTLGIQFGIYPQYLVQPFTSGTSLNYDLWVDDVTLYKGSDGLGTWTSSSGTAHPFPVDSAKVGSCTKPTGASGKYLVQMYNQWKKLFVVSGGGGMRVQRPENSNDTVSEGIGYGMLIAAYMGDKALFDGLWAYEGSGSNRAVGMLMNWTCPGGGGCNGGSATDADEDMAFALIEAGKQWGGTYASTAAQMIKDIGDHDIDTAAMLPNGGSNFGNGMQTNPSYWAPAYYKVFATIDTGHPWNTIASNVYTALNAIAGKSTGNAAGALVPAWCSGSSCGNVAGSGYTDGGIYQYDAHRVPWRFGLDVCWNGGSTPFLAKNAGFFSGIAANGVGRIVDIYTLSGTPNSDAAPNSMSIVGTAGVGAMAASSSFANTAWQFLLDASYSPQSQIKDTMGHIGYTYYNATVGLIAALTLSGNFNNF